MKRSGAVARRSVTARPKIREQLIRLVRLALLGAVGARFRRFGLGQVRDGVGSLRFVQHRAVLGVGRELLLRLGLRRVDGFLGGVHRRVLRGPLLLELRERFLHRGNLRAERGLGIHALREDLGDAPAGLIERLDELAALDLAKPQAREHAENAELGLPHARELGRSVLQPRVDVRKLAPRVVEHSLDRREHVVAAQHAMATSR